MWTELTKNMLRAMEDSDRIVWFILLSMMLTSTTAVLVIAVTAFV